MEGISICVQAHKNGTVSMNIQIPTDRINVEFEQGIGASRKIRNYKDIDPGYETEETEKNWCGTEDEGRIYDNLD